MNRKPVTIILMIAISMIFILGANAQLFGKSANLLKNGGFEAARNNFPKDWRNRDEPLPTSVKVEISQDNPHSGKQCLLINNMEPGDTMVIQKMKVKAEKVYLMSVWIRAENVAQQAGSANVTLYYDGAPGIITSQEFRDTGSQWIKLEFPFRTLKTKASLVCGLRLGGEGVVNQGKVYFDDIEVKEVSGRDDAITFYVPGEPETPSSNPPIPAKTLLFVITGTLIVCILVFLEFSLSMKEKKEEAEAKKADLEKTGQE
ncbi:MAG: carbohydrate binding domain-containing protein [Firmicutes bacterium]|nr:carbohydrate binding domain-containing protein [Bacillota bacterium]